MIKTEDILSMEYLKKTEFTGSNQNMRYRLSCITVEDKKRLLAYVWPEPLNFVSTPDEQKQHEEFEFSQDGVCDAVAWMNDRLFEYQE